MVSEKKNFDFFLFFFSKIDLVCRKMSNEAIWTKYGGLLNKHSCKKKINISNETVEIVNFHCMYMENLSCHSNKIQLDSDNKILLLRRVLMS